MKTISMYKHYLLIAMILCGISFDASAQKSNTAKTERNMNPTSFTTLKVEGPIEVYLTVGNTPEVRIVTTEEVHNEIEYSQRGQSVTLKWNKTKGTAKGTLVQAYVTMPEVKNLNLSGAAGVIIDKPIPSTGELSGRLNSSAILKRDVPQYNDFFRE